MYKNNFRIYTENNKIMQTTVVNCYCERYAFHALDNVTISLNRDGAAWKAIYGKYSLKNDQSYTVIYP